MPTMKHLRSHPRYRIPQDVLIEAGVEMSGELTAIGRLENISEGGARIILSSAQRKPSIDETGRIEVQTNGKIVQACGSIASVVSHPRGSTAVGIQFTESSNALSEFVDELIQLTAGAVHVYSNGELRIEVHGYLSFQLRSDFAYAIRTSLPCPIVLDRCTGMDTAGYEMLAMARERGAIIDRPSQKVSSILGIGRLA